VSFDGRALISRIQLQESLTAETASSFQTVGIDRMFDFVMSISGEKPCSEVLQSVEAVREIFDKTLDGISWSPHQARETRQGRWQGSDRVAIARPASVGDARDVNRTLSSQSPMAAKGNSILSVLQSEIASRAGQLEEKHMKQVQRDHLLYKSMNKELLSGKEGLTGRSKMDGVHVWRDSFSIGRLSTAPPRDNSPGASRYAVDTDQIYQKALTGLDYFDRADKRDSILPCLSPMRPVSRCTTLYGVLPGDMCS